MTGPDSTTARAFAWRATLVALLGGAAAAALAAGRPPADRVWLLLGWGVLAVAGTLGGAWLASEHGKPGSRFLVALGAGVAARFVAVAGGCVAAALAGKSALTAYATGLIAGFVPVQAFEALWFLRRTRARA
jgi:hypothetical protein